jgi:hypothetical protein
MWLLILLAVHVNDPTDIPGRVELQFRDQRSCEEVLNSMKWNLKFKSFKVEGKCQKQYS